MAEREFYEQLVIDIADLKKRVARIERGEAYRFSQSLDDVSNPPTAIQAAAAFSAAATVGDGFPCIIDDNGAGVSGYLLVVINGSYWQVALTKCV